MDNFDFKKYLKEGRINKDFSQLDEKKQDSKKGNKEEQKRMEGAIRDNRDHIKSLEKDIKADEKKLAKLKSDEPKDVNEMKKQGYDDREDESLGARKGAEKDKKVSMKGRRDDSYGKIGKRDAEAKGKNKINKEEIEVEEGYGKKYEEDDVKSMSEDARTDAEQEGYKDGFDDAKDDIEGALKKMKVSELKAKIRETILAELSLSEDGFQADEAGSQYHAGLYNEAEEDVDVDIEDDVEADVDVDVKDTVDVDAEGDDIEIVKPAVKAKVEVGLSPEEEIVQDSLKAAMDAADALGNDKLADQIGNTITFFTREYVVGRNSD